MSVSDDTDAEEVAREVRRKAERLLRSRRERSSFWSQLAHVGVLGWLFILPAVLLSTAGHLIGRATGKNAWAVAGVVLGLLAGAYLVWRQVRPTLDDAGPAPPGDRGGAEGPGGGP